MPTEPSLSPWLQQPKQVFCWAQFLYDAGGRRRGGWVSGAFGRTDPGHVPTEPPHHFDFWCHVVEFDLGLGPRHKYVVLFFLDDSSDCMDFYGRSCKLTVSVRQPVRLWILSNQWDALLFGYEQTGFFVGVTSGTFSWSIPGLHVVLPPCWYGGLLNTPCVQFTAELMLGLLPVPWVMLFSGSPFLAFSFAAPSCATSGHITSEIDWHSGDYANFLFFTGESGPLRRAGPHEVLQRQILLPVVLRFFSSVSLAPFACTPASGTDDDLDASDFCNFLERTWVHQLRFQLQDIADTCALRAVLLLHALGMETGRCLMAMCRAGSMLTLCYLCRLLFFGWRLKGGAYNCDNILLAARSASAAVPWHLGIGLRSFFFRLQGNEETPKRHSKRCSCYSVDLFLLICLVATLLNPAAAAHSRCPSAHPTEFPTAPVYQDDENLDRGLLRDPRVAADLVPDPGLAGLPPTIYITRAYKLFGFGHQPEYISCTTTSTATMQRCLELLEPDLGVQRTGGTGALHPLNGPAVIDELQAHWIPEWVLSALGRLVIVDASLLGYTPFQVYVQDGIISYHRINRIMPELDGSEYYIFIPSQDGDPLAYEGYPSRMIVNHGDVVHLTPDPAPPQAVQDVPCTHFSDWSFTEFADGHDEPTGGLRIMVLTDRERFLIEAVEGESDALLTQRICAELQVSASRASLVRPREPFERPMYYQYHLSDIVFLLETPLTGTELVVFVDSRPVLQTFSAIRLRQPRVPVGEAIDLFKIRVEAIEGYRLWLKGGKKRQDCLVAEHRGKFWVKLEAKRWNSRRITLIALVPPMTALVMMILRVLVQARQGPLSRSLRRTLQTTPLFLQMRALRVLRGRVAVLPITVCTYLGLSQSQTVGSKIQLCGAVLEVMKPSHKAGRGTPLAVFVAIPRLQCLQQPGNVAFQPSMVHVSGFGCSV